MGAALAGQQPLTEKQSRHLRGVKSLLFTSLNLNKPVSSGLDFFFLNWKLVLLELESWHLQPVVLFFVYTRPIEAVGEHYTLAHTQAYILNL